MVNKPVLCCPRCGSLDMKWHRRPMVSYNYCCRCGWDDIGKGEKESGEQRKKRGICPKITG